MVAGGAASSLGPPGFRRQSSWKASPAALSAGSDRLGSAMPARSAETAPFSDLQISIQPATIASTCSIRIEGSALVSVAPAPVFTDGGPPYVSRLEGIGAVATEGGGRWLLNWERPDAPSEEAMRLAPEGGRRAQGHICYGASGRQSLSAHPGRGARQLQSPPNEGESSPVYWRSHVEVLCAAKGRRRDLASTIVSCILTYVSKPPNCVPSVEAPTGG
jgi:hypothetical protein